MVEWVSAVYFYFTAEQKQKRQQRRYLQVFSNLPGPAGHGSGDLMPVFAKASQMFLSGISLQHISYF
jgi:hypothetical protein